MKIHISAFFLTCSLAIARDYSEFKLPQANIAGLPAIEITCKPLTEDYDVVLEAHGHRISLKYYFPRKSAEESDSLSDPWREPLSALYIVREVNYISESYLPMLDGGNELAKEWRGRFLEALEKFERWEAQAAKERIAGTTKLLSYEIPEKPAGDDGRSLYYSISYDFISEQEGRECSMRIYETSYLKRPESSNFQTYIIPSGVARGIRALLVSKEIKDVVMKDRMRRAREEYEQRMRNEKMKEKLK